MEEVDYATLGSAFDRINSENNCLRREASSLNGALSDYSPSSEGSGRTSMGLLQITTV